MFNPKWPTISAMGGEKAERPTSRDAKAAASRARAPDGHTLTDLQSLAARKNVAGRSRMSELILKTSWVPPDHFWTMNSVASIKSVPTIVFTEMRNGAKVPAPSTGASHT